MADETVGPPQIAGLDFRGVLGAGGFADVYRYKQSALGRDVAVKVIHGLGDAARTQFHAEANVMARLSSHPFVVPIYQVGESDDGRPYLVMQLCPLPTLAARVAHKSLPVEDVVRFGVQLSGAVESAHRMGILHRDIKPANILFNEYGHPLLADFGISQSADHGGGLRAFTPSFAPQEQVAGHESTPAVDVFGLCATLWAALTGEPPAMPVAEGFPSPTLGRDDAPPGLEKVLLGGLAFEPGDRHSSALVVGRALQKVQNELGVYVTPIELWDGHGQGPDTVAVPPPPTDARTHLVTLQKSPRLLPDDAGDPGIGEVPAEPVPDENPDGAVEFDPEAVAAESSAAEQDGPATGSADVAGGGSRPVTPMPPAAPGLPGHPPFVPVWQRETPTAPQAPSGAGPEESREASPASPGDAGPDAAPHRPPAEADRTVMPAASPADAQPPTPADPAPRKPAPAASFAAVPPVAATPQNEAPARREAPVEQPATRDVPGRDAAASQPSEPKSAQVTPTPVASGSAAPAEASPGRPGSGSARRLLAALGIVVVLALAIAGVWRIAGGPPTLAPRAPPAPPRARRRPMDPSCSRASGASDRGTVAERTRHRLRR